ncbi:MAG TPA: hypothetical protein VFW23_12195 [Tepidisphaeraceae bacterium]|nr:hypothetical protein [Tepidisphaeraceae bacterium]
MKKAFATLFAAAVITSTVFTVGCSTETSHEEKTSPTLTGGQKHEETTTYKNPDGSTTIDHSKSVSHD